MLETRLLSIKGELFQFTALPEDISYNDQFDDPRDIEWIEDQLSIGNDAAWFCAKISLLKADGTSEYKEVDSTYLGGCSYNSFDEFINTKDGYLQDMVNELLEALKNQTMKAGAV